MAPAPRDPRIAELVAALSEVYQPIHGHPEYDASARRACDDRLTAVLRAVVWVGGQRKLRILDIGCNQGWFSLQLAALGHDVLGIDSDPANIALARALAAESGIAARFEVATFDESWLARQEDGAFDLALVLSVFQHVSHAVGFVRARRMARKLAQRSRALVCELALREEPLYWAAALPGDPEELLADIAFVREMGRFATHLSELRRPMFFASDTLCAVDTQGYAIQRWNATAHEDERGFHQGTRRYYFCAGDILVKSVRIAGPNAEYNREESSREEAFLRQHGGKLAWVPAGLRAETAGDRRLSARPMIPGARLSTLLHGKIAFDAARVLRDVLGQLAELEACGLYHRDVRSWNVVVGDDGTSRLIDFWQIGLGVATDGSGLMGAHDAFWSLVHEATRGEPNVRPIPLMRRNPEALPEPWRSTLARFLEAGGKPTFAGIAKELARSTTLPPVSTAAAQRAYARAAADFERFAEALVRLVP